MAWMPVAEAAARLGVSERTIWRRIKSDSIQSRNEAGRTLVMFDEQGDDSETVRQLSHVAAAQLSMRKLDADTMGEVLGQLGECRTSFEREMGRKRTALRITALVAAVLALALGAGVIYHTDTLTRLRADHVADLDALRTEHQQELGDQQAVIARSEGTAKAQADEVAHLRKASMEYQTHLAALEASRNELQCTVEERLEDLAAELAMSSSADGAVAVDRAALTEKVAELRDALHRKELAYVEAQKQSERIAATLHAQAARSAGLAEGLRLHVELQEKSIARMQGELDDMRMMLAMSHSPVSPTTDAVAAHGTLDELSLRRSLRDSMLSEPEQAAAADVVPTEVAIQTVQDWVGEWLANQRAAEAEEATAVATPETKTPGADASTTSKSPQDAFAAAE
ncbi:MAG: hypothetical protein H6817_10385 [Phycisphaerales bacterium]|nr:hypothetical protein [Phycisphaerales bacterium]